MTDYKKEYLIEKAKAEKFERLYIQTLAAFDIFKAKDKERKDRAKQTKAAKGSTGVYLEFENTEFENEVFDFNDFE